MRAVLDPNIIISALLSPEGPPARTILAWLRGEFEVVVSPLLLSELERALGYAKLRRRIPVEEAEATIELFARSATIVEDPPGPPAVHSVDPGDDYLLALASSQDAAIISGDEHLLSLAGELPIHSPRNFLVLLNQLPP